MLKEHETRIHTKSHRSFIPLSNRILFNSLTHSHAHKRFFLKKMYVIQNRKEEGKKYYESKRLPENPIRYT